jgi:uncharacterized integral membrane protein
MGNLWLKIKVWTKIAVFAIVFLYIIIFVAKNSERQVKPWFWFNYEPETTVLPLVLWAFGTGVVGTILVRTTFRTLRQFRDMQERGRTEKMHRELQDMKNKAGMLRPKPNAATADPSHHDTEDSS